MGIEGLSEEVLARIVELILKYKKPEKIVIFGSRAKSSFTKTSDIDIAIFAKEWLDRDFNIIRHELNERIKTPLKFDVLNFYGVEKAKLKENILKEGKVIYDAGKD